VQDSAEVRQPWQKLRASGSLPLIKLASMVSAVDGRPSGRNPSNREDIMRVVLAAVTISAATCLAGLSSAIATPTKAVSDAVAAPAKGTIVVAQRCRCVERRWNGSCKLRVCKDHW
jgi:hypothetical protein